MLAKVLSSAVFGIDAYTVEVEVDIATGLPAFSTVGLPDVAIRESKDRVKAAIKNCGYEFPSRRITVNLAPADIRKEGAAFDLPIAVGILAATDLVRKDKLGAFFILGELSLNGDVKLIRGTLSVSVAARDSGLRGLIIPEGNAKEAAVVKGVEVLAVKNLFEVVDFLNGDREIQPAAVDLQDDRNDHRVNKRHTHLSQQDRSFRQSAGIQSLQCLSLALTSKRICDRRPHHHQRYKD